MKTMASSSKITNIICEPLLTASDGNCGSYYSSTNYVFSSRITRDLTQFVVPGAGGVLGDAFAINPQNNWAITNFGAPGMGQRTVSVARGCLDDDSDCSPACSEPDVCSTYVFEVDRQSLIDHAEIEIYLPQFVNVGYVVDSATCLPIDYDGTEELAPNGFPMDMTTVASELIVLDPINENFQANNDFHVGPLESQKACFAEVGMSYFKERNLGKVLLPGKIELIVDEIVFKSGNAAIYRCDGTALTENNFITSLKRIPTSSENVNYGLGWAANFQFHAGGAFDSTFLAPAVEFHSLTIEVKLRKPSEYLVNYWGLHNPFYIDMVPPPAAQLAAAAAASTTVTGGGAAADVAATVSATVSAAAAVDPTTPGVVARNVLKVFTAMRKRNKRPVLQSRNRFPETSLLGVLMLSDLTDSGAIVSENEYMCGYTAAAAIYVGTLPTKTLAAKIQDLAFEVNIINSLRFCIKKRCGTECCDEDEEEKAGAKLVLEIDAAVAAESLSVMGAQSGYQYMALSGQDFFDAVAADANPNGEIQRARVRSVWASYVNVHYTQRGVINDWTVDPALATDQFGFDAARPCSTLLSFANNGLEASYFGHNMPNTTQAHAMVFRRIQVLEGTTYLNNGVDSKIRTGIPAAVLNSDAVSFGGNVRANDVLTWLSQTAFYSAGALGAAGSRFSDVNRTSAFYNMVKLEVFTVIATTYNICAGWVVDFARTQTMLIAYIRALQKLRYMLGMTGVALTMS